LFSRAMLTVLFRHADTAQIEEPWPVGFILLYCNQ